MALKYAEWRETVKTLREQWRKMWRERIDDKVRAEGITSQDFMELFVEQGTVIIASRDYRPPDFEEILENHRPEAMKSQELPLHPSRGGYGKFIRDVILNQTRYGSEDQRKRLVKREKEKKRQPLKKGGRGWLHSTR
jgi:hypothetical protein